MRDNGRNIASFISVMYVTEKIEYDIRLAMMIIVA